MEKFLVKCIKTLVMDGDGETAFIQDKVYWMESKAGFFLTENEQGSRHYFDDFGVDDYNHWFECVKEGSLK